MGGQAHGTFGAKTPLESLLDYSTYMPLTMKIMNKQIPKTAQAMLQAAQQTTPAYNALNLQQLQKFALPEALVGQQVARSNALAGAETNLAQLQGAGGQAARVASDLNRQLNPEYYSSLASAGDQLAAANAAYQPAVRGATDVVNAINLQGLSPGEANAVERSLAQTNSKTGNLGLINPTNTISNAINFGGAFNNKLGLMQGATSNLANIAGGLGNLGSGYINIANSAANSGFNPVNVALGQPNVSTAGNFGTGQFVQSNQGTSGGAANTAFGGMGNIFSNMTSGNNAAIGGGAGIQSAVIGGMSGMGQQAMGGMCCFIFLEAYHGKLPKVIRKIRDKYYNRHPRIANGYKKMAKWLVPLMKKSKIVRFLVWYSMVSPATKYATSLHCGPNKRISHFWLKTWYLIGG